MCHSKERKSKITGAEYQEAMLALQRNETLDPPARDKIVESLMKEAGIRGPGAKKQVTKAN